MRNSFLFHRTSAVLFLFSGVGVLGQEAASPAQLTVSSPPLTLESSTFLPSFQQEQMVLAQSFNALIAQGATPEQLQAWQQQNATALASQQQLALVMAAESEVQPMVLVPAPNLPANASQTLRDFLTAQAALANARAQIHNQLLNALPADVTTADLSQMQQSEAQLFLQQQGANLQLQTQRAQALADASVQQPAPLPPPLAIPAGATPALAAYLTACDQLMRDRITFANQYLTAAPAVRDAALAQWTQQNAARYQQLSQLAQNLSPAPSTPAN